jgi:thioredoxin reductase (NADPH)
MAKPVLLTVDDDPGVSRAIERDLRRRFGSDFRVLRAESGEQGLDLLNKLKLRDDRVALLLADQRMPRMTGVEFLERAIDVYPEAKRALLTAYADTEAAIKAINDVDLDHYLRKPWDPPEEILYPVVADMLAAWEADAPPETEDVRLIGHRILAGSHALRDLLARNDISYRWLDADDAEGNRLLSAAGVERPALPVAILKDGTVLEDPAPLALAEALGLQTQAERSLYDLVVVGGGPAGLAASVYGASEGLRTLMVEREAPGGQAGQSSLIENYLGFPNGLSGRDLARRASAQVKRFKAEVLAVQAVEHLDDTGAAKVLRLSGGDELRAHAVVISTGVAYRKLEAPGVDGFTGAGVYYGAAMTEATSCQDEHVVVVGGANSAGQAAMYFATNGVGKVTMLIRGSSIEKGMSQYLVERIQAQQNIEVRLGTRVAEAHGDGRLQAVTVRRQWPEGVVDERLEPIAAMFIFIGAQPQTDWLDGQVQRDERGFILSGPDLLPDGHKPPGWKLERDPFLLETSVPGVFVAGDVRHGSVKRVASSVGEGAMAVRFVHEHLAGR